MRTGFICVVLAWALTACGDDGGGTDAGPGDGGSPTDSGRDSGPGADAGGSDSGDDDAGGTDGGGGADTWGNFAMEWFATYCTECHNEGGSTSREYRMITDVVRDQARIRCGVSPDEATGCGSGFPAPSQFPIGDGPFPDDAARRRLVAWIDNGLPE